jgi:replicative DNA helicase
MNSNAKNKQAMLKETFSNKKTDPNAEKALINCLLSYSSLHTNTVFEILNPKMFTDFPCRLACKAMIELWKEKESINILTVANKAKAIHGSSYQGDSVAFIISQLTNGYVAETEFSSIYKIVIKLYFQRIGIQKAYEIIEAIVENDNEPDLLFMEAVDSIKSISERIFIDDEDNSIEFYSQKLTQYVSEVIKGNVAPYISTGFQEVDKLHNGLTSTDLLIYAARPGVGKTAFALAVAKNAASANVPVAIFSLEMLGEHLLGRMAAAEAKINAQLIRDPRKMTDSENMKYHESIAKLQSLPIYFIDNISYLEALERKARDLVKHKGVRVIIIDYLQLIKTHSKGEPREQVVSTISRNLKAMAKELKIPLIALSQLSRAVETRGGEKKPVLSDLRESGSIEQDADIVVFFYRPAYYNIFNDEQGHDLSKTMCYIIAKNRHGPLDTVYMKFNKFTTEIVEDLVKSVEIEHNTENKDEPF